MTIKKLICNLFDHSYPFVCAQADENGKPFQPLVCERCGYKKNHYIPYFEVEIFYEDGKPNVRFKK